MADEDESSFHEATALALQSLSEVRHFFEEARTSYHEPNLFILNVNHFLQAARNVTWRLQACKNDIVDFDQWYLPWQNEIREHTLMAWLKNARNKVVKSTGLETHSTARVTVVTSYADVRERVFDISPFIATRTMINVATAALPSDDRVCASIQIERRWVDRNLPQYELLDAMAECLRVLEGLVEDLVVWHTQGGPCIDPSQVLADRLPLYAKNELNHSRTIRFVPSANEDRCRAGLVESPAPDIPSEYLRERYGKVDFPKVDATDPYELASLYAPIARRVLERDGYHMTLAHLRYPNGEWHQADMFVQDRVEKFVVWNKLAEWIDKHDCDAVVVVSEVWLMSTENLDLDLVPPQPEDVPDKEEALIIHITTADGRARFWSQSFHREDGRIVWDDADMVEEEPLDLKDCNYLKPIWAVWRRRLQDTQTSGL